MRGEQDHGQGEVLLADGVKQRQTVHAGHAQIGDDNVGPAGGERGQRSFAALGTAGIEAAGFEADGEQAEQIGVVIDEQDAGLSRGHLVGGRSRILTSISRMASSF